jgi:hypothetical protein
MGNYRSIELSQLRKGMNQNRKMISEAISRNTVKMKNPKIPVLIATRIRKRRVTVIHQQSVLAGEIVNEIVRVDQRIVNVRSHGIVQDIAVFPGTGLVIETEIETVVAHGPETGHATAQEIAPVTDPVSAVQEIVVSRESVR